MNNIYYITGNHINKPYRDNEYGSNIANKNVKISSNLNFPIDEYSNNKYNFLYRDNYNISNTINHENSKDIAGTFGDTNLSYSSLDSRKAINRFTFARPSSTTEPISNRLTSR